MKTDGNVESGLADSQVINCHSLCCWSLDKAVKDRLIARNSAEGCKLPTFTREEMKILSREVKQRLPGICDRTPAGGTDGAPVG